MYIYPHAHEDSYYERARVEGVDGLGLSAEQEALRQQLEELAHKTVYYMYI